MDFNTNYNKTLSKFNLTKIVLVFLILFTVEGTSQISYSYACGSTSDFTVSGFGAASSGSYNTCSGYSFRDNLWNYGGSREAYFYKNYGSEGSGNNGNQVTFEFDFKATGYNSGTITSTSNYHGKLFYSTTGSSWTEVGDMSETSSSGCQTKTFTHTPSAGSNVYYKVHIYWDAGDIDVYVDNISISQTSGPSISNGSLSGSSFTACSGAAGGERSFSVTGSSLTGDLTVTPPSGYEVSTTSGSGFNSSSITLSESGGSVSTTVYARLTSSASDGASGNIAISGGGATTVNVATGTGVISHSAYYVDDAGNNSNAGTSSGVPFATVAYAISKVGGCASTTINVDAGSYSEEEIEIPDGTANVTIDGAGIASTIFTGDGNGRFLHLNNSGDSDASSNSNNITISDMKITGYSKTTSGGAVRIEENISTNINFSNVHFHSNTLATSNEGGGAVHLEDGSAATFTSCTFSSNSTTYQGGAIYSEGTTSNNNTLSLVKCKFYTNSASSSGSYGGAIESDYTANTVTNCLFYENTSGGYGGAINHYYGSTTAFNNTFADNTATNYYGGAIRCNYGTHTFTNCILYGNSAGTYNDVYEGSGSIILDYCICPCTSTSGASETNDVGSSDPNFNDAANDDYTLTSSSSAIDAGTATGAPSEDINGTSRPSGAADDLGCYEYVLNTWQGGTAGNETVWSNAGNWSTGSVPGSSEAIVIADVTYNPVLDVTDQVGAITIQSGGVLTISSVAILTASSVDLQSGGSLSLSNGELNSTGKFDHDGGLTISGGTLDIDGEYESSASATESISAGTIEVAGEWDGANDDAFTPTGGTVTMNGTANQNLAQHASSNFYNLTISNSNSSDVDVTAALDINNDLTINASADLDIGGGNANIELAGSLSNSGTFTTSGESITFDGTGDKTCSAISDADMDIVINKSSSGSVTFSGTCSFDEFTVSDGKAAITSNTMTCDNAVSIADGDELEIGTGTFNADGSFTANTSGIIDFTGAGKLVCSGAVSSLGSLDDAQGTVEYDLATQAVAADTYYNLIISTAGTKTAGGAIIVNKDLTTAATASCKLDMGANNLTLKGDLNVGATNGLDLSDASCTFTISGTSAQGVTHAGMSAGTSMSESFSSTSLPSGWTRSSSSAVLFENGGCTVGTADNYYLELRGVDDANAVTPTLDMTGVSSIDVSFYYRSGCHNSAEGSDCAQVEYYNGSSWVVLTGWPKCGAVSNTQHTQNITSVSNSDFKLRFYVNSGTGVDYDDWSFDDIVITPNGSANHFKNLTVNNSAGFTMNSDLNIEGTLNLSSGSINTNGNSLHITSTGSVTGSKGTSPCNCVYPDSYSQELTTTSATEFRIGNNAGSERKSVWVQPASATSVTFSADFVPTPHSDRTDCGTDLDHISTASYYDINRTAGSVNAKIKLGWYTNDVVNDYSNILLAHYDGSQWQKVVSTPSGSNTSGTVISDAVISSFSPFALGSSNSGNALPIDLVSFNGECQKNEVELEFVVASQINNDFFTIERSANNKDWTTVAEIAGIGNTSTQMSYDWIDFNPISGTSYYQLTQTDFDGKSETFAPITVSCDQQTIGVYNVYPNPATDELMIDLELDSYQGDNIKVQLVDINGRIVKQKPITMERGFNHVELSIKEVPNGIYLLQFSGTNSHIKESRVVKQ